MKLTTGLVIRTILPLACVVAGCAAHQPQHTIRVDNFRYSYEDGGESARRVFAACDAGATDIILVKPTGEAVTIYCKDLKSKPN